MDPLAQAASADAEQRYQEAVGRYQAANREALGVYKQLSALSPEDSGAASALGPGSGGSRRRSIRRSTVYKRFVNRFPTDPLVVDARQKIKELKAQKIAQQATGEAEG